MSLLFSSRRVSALAGLLLVLGCVSVLPAPRRVASPLGSACLLLSPNVEDGLNLAEARRRLGSPQHARYRRLAREILEQLGVRRYQVQDALGEWQGGVENSLLVTLGGSADPDTLACAAACFGLAARQKAVLAFHADSAGPDKLVTLEMPGQSLDEVCRWLDQSGLRERTLIPARTGWRVVLLLAAGQPMPAVARPEIRLQIQLGRAVLLGDPTRAGASERYRQVIHAYRTTHLCSRLACVAR